MHIHIDEKTGKITYDRKLQDGRGTNLYGLEVCKALGMPDGFVSQAQQVRRHIQKVSHSFIPNKLSRYNRDVYIDVCAICKAPAEETNHIQYQCTADDNKLLKDGKHIHHKSNLVPLCEHCHMKEHQGQINIKGYKHTSEGTVLDYDTFDQVTPMDIDGDLVQMHDTLKGYMKYSAEKGWFWRSNNKWNPISVKTLQTRIKKAVNICATIQMLSDCQHVYSEIPGM